MKKPMARGGLVSLLMASGLLMSAYCYCPPDAQSSAPSPAGCCAGKTDHGGCPLQPKHETSLRACCAAERLTAQNPSKIERTSVVFPLYAVAVGSVRPILERHGFAEAPAFAAGPPGGIVPSLGNRAPPLA